MKSKTWATWLAFLGGPIGLHRFYLHGSRDLWGWLLPIPSLLGVWGITRVFQYGQDDQLSWVLIPLLGFTVAGCCLTAIIYGLMSPEAWNARFNANQESEAGGTHWGTIFGIVLSLMVGAGVLMASFAFSFERYFEKQIEEGRQISE